jgi:hypothetical protein
VISTHFSENHGQRRPSLKSELRFNVAVKLRRPKIYYLYNPETALYYPVSSAIEVETGLVTITISQDGVASNPGYVPAEGEVLCPIEYYLSYFNLAAESVNGNRYMQFAGAVTRQVERYTNNSWADLSVPEDLLSITARMIRDRFTEADKNVDPRMQSESVKNYSYTLSNLTAGQPSLAKYEPELDQFRKLAFGCGEE